MTARELRLWILSHLEPWWIEHFARKQSRRWVPDMPSREEAEAYMRRNADKWARPLLPPLGPWEIR